MFVKMKTNKSINLIVIAMLLMICVIAFTACGGGSDDSRPELTLTTNIEGAGTVSGGGHFDYNEDLFINAEVNNGYYFLGWYYDNELLSTSAEYNCKMWDKDVTLEAKFIALPDDYDEAFGDMSPEELINRNFKLSVVAGMPNYGKISVNDGTDKDEYSSSEKSGTSIKARALTTSSKRFLGWFDEADNLVMTNAVFKFNTPSFDYTLTAKWECNCDFVLDSQKGTYGCKACGNLHTLEELSDENGLVILKDGRETEVLTYIGNASNLTIPNNVTKIRYEAFKSCRSLTSITIPDSVTSIGYRAFDGCFKLADINIGNNVTSIGINAFNDTEFYSNESNWENDVLYIGKYLIKSLESLSGIYNINPDTLCIADEAFNDCYDLTSVTIPNSTTSIGDKAFSGCTSLASVTIGNSVTSIGDDAFNSCSSLASVTIPDSVINIGFSAFAYCSNLTSVTIGNSVTNVGDFVFERCGSIAKIKFNGTSAQWKKISQNFDWEYGIPAKKVVCTDKNVSIE